MTKDQKRIAIYTILFVFVMIVDQRTLTAMNYARVAFVQAALIPFLLVMLMQVKKEKIKIKEYLILATGECVIFLIGAGVMFNSLEFYLKYIIFLFEMLIYIFILVYGLINREEFFNKNSKRNWIFGIWFFVFLSMALSNYNGYWTWFVMLLFVPFANIRISKGEQKNILKGMIFGIILSYFLIQGYAFIFRPYDMLQYNGSFNNANMNSLFYTVAFTAFLVNAIMLYEKKTKKWLQYLNIFFAASTIGFSLLTGCKTGLLTQFLIFALYLFVIFLSNKKSLKRIAIEVLIYFAFIVVLTPVCYLVARYTPPIFHHTVWFYGEYSENKIHSYDSYDSDKYPETIEVTNTLIKRYTGIDEFFDIEDEEVINLDIDYEATEMLDEAQINEGEVVETKLNSEQELGDVLTKKRGSGLGSVSSRIFIWKEYLIRLNIFGHEKIEGVAHAHNVFIEYLYYFGIFPGGLFAIGYMLTALRQLIITYKEKSFLAFGTLSLYLLFGIYGFAELSWYLGQATLSICMFMIVFFVWNKNEEIEKEKTNSEK